MKTSRQLAPLLLLLAISACDGARGGADPSSTTKAPATPSTSAASAAPAAATQEVPKEVRAVVDAPDRDEADKKLDAGRHPAELLAFAGVKPGMRVAEIVAAGGYTTELLARAVGPTGKVFGQNTAVILEKFAEKPWAARLAKPVNANVAKVTRDLEDPLPPEATNLDVVLDVLFYHDTFWLKVDRAKMNAAIFKALKPGGAYVIVDHTAKKGAGASDVQTLHRIEESTVREEIERAGFKLAASADFLRNPNDARDWSASPGAAAEKRGTSDRFVLRFVKP
jgi:predicted methyltransferase